jgi:hypothetical protein
MGEGEDWADDLGLNDRLGYYKRRTMRQTARPETEENMRTEEATGRASRRGFGGYNKAADGLNRTTFQVKDDTEVIAFLEPENFTFALRHWVKYVDETSNQVTRAEWCLEDECPLCDIGDRPKAVCFFNVVDLANAGKVLVWEASADPTEAIQKEFNKLQQRGKNLNDSDVYWAVSKSKGKNGFYSYSVDKVTEDDLNSAPAFKNIKPLTESQRIALGTKLYDEAYVEYKERQELQDFVDTLG